MVLLLNLLHLCRLFVLYSFFFNDTATTEIYTLSLHDALPIAARTRRRAAGRGGDNAPRDRWRGRRARPVPRSEEHTSELQSRRDLVCRLLLEKKKKKMLHFLLRKKKKTKVK